MEGVLPDRILHRKKSPYPKTHDPAYELLTKTALLAIVNDPNSRLYHLLNRKKLLSFMNGEDATWFGQLMARPQLYAWLLQLEYWLETYRVSLV
jgi:asparagine synthase (glutamine-hydrolysing)